MLIFVAIMEKLLATQAANEAKAAGIELLFRQHVCTENKYYLSYDPGNRKLKVSDPNGQDNITGNIIYNDRPLRTRYLREEQIAEKLIVTRAEIDNFYLEFLSLFNEEADYRTFICALTFRKVIHSRSFLNLYDFKFSDLKNFLRETNTLQINQSALWISTPFLWRNLMSNPGDITIMLSVCQSYDEKRCKYLRLFYYECHFDGVLMLKCRTTVISLYPAEEGRIDRS
ncbi:TPA: hypothetical protein ACHTOV_003687 [Enterobacter cancerogenus]|uniref:hypothetical protein n=2 Tax=Enterobacter cloacae complex TaxID=354276 RepID=UPI00129967CC|nr:hypothetical protein [Enterobacter cancerogenus]MRG34136.1 hypothetical protein [Enterobacter cancerogenus]QZY39524.1 hypothetical protein HU826_24385 [Enterobacter cancerogenus]